MTMRAPAAFALLVGLAGCATVDHAVDAATPMAETGIDLARQGVHGAYRAATGPHLTSVSNPALVSATPVVMPMPAQMQTTSAPNSLWQAGARTFFKWLALPTLGHQAIDQLRSEVLGSVLVEDRVHPLW